MKRRYSPAARKAHLRRLHRQPVVQEVTPVGKLIEAYQGGFLTAVELADLILQTLPQPEPVPCCKYCQYNHDRGDGFCDDSCKERYAAAVRRAELNAAIQLEPAPKPEQEYQSVTYYPETDITVAIGPETPYDPENWPQHLHADDCQCHLCWAASLDMPSPPWEGGAA